MNTKKPSSQRDSSLLEKIDSALSSGHHSFLLVAEKSEALFCLKKYFMPEDGSGNPDFRIYEPDFLSIDLAREVASFEAESPLGTGNKIIVISAGIFPANAQNTLLKSLEEPSGKTKFFVVAEETENFLPTFVSRFFIISAEGGHGPAKTVPSEDMLDARTFLRSGPKERLDTAKKAQEALKKEKISRKDVAKFIARAEGILAGMLKKTKGAPPRSLITAVKKAEVLRSFALDQGSSVKQILTAFALSVPIPEDLEHLSDVVK